MECLSYNAAQGYKLAQVFLFLQQEEQEVSRFGDVVFYKSKNQFVYIFAFGAIVLWNIDSLKALSLIQSLRPFTDEPAKQYEIEKFAYEIGKQTAINEQKDTIILEKDADALYKLALSYALAQSIKLGSYEKELKITISEMTIIPKNLAKTGTTSLKPHEISKKIGELYLQKWAINNNLNFMHTPRVIWDRPEIEPYYKMTSKFLDLHTRVESLNMGLTMIQDLLEILEDQLSTKRGLMLEWTIIALIFLEIVLFVAKDLLHYVFKIKVF